MTNPDLISTDPIVARNFFLQLGSDQILLHSVEGFDIELEVVSTAQNGRMGQQQHVKTLGGRLVAPKIVVGRMAPLDAKKDPIWEWFLLLRTTGMKAQDRTDQRRDGSIFLLDSTYKKVGQFSFFNGWPSKIATSGVSTESSAPLTETITFECERIERVLV